MAHNSFEMLCTASCDLLLIHLSMPVIIYGMSLRPRWQFRREISFHPLLLSGTVRLWDGRPTCLGTNVLGGTTVRLIVRDGTHPRSIPRVDRWLLPFRFRALDPRLTVPVIRSASTRPSTNPTIHPTATSIIVVFFCTHVTSPGPRFSRVAVCAGDGV